VRRSLPIEIQARIIADPQATARRKAFVIEKYIQPEQLPTRLVEWAEPKPGQNDIVVDVHYAGLNCASAFWLPSSARAQTLTLFVVLAVFDSASPPPSLRHPAPARPRCATRPSLRTDELTRARAPPAVLQVQGKYQLKPAFPWIAGCEFSGIVSRTSPIPEGCTYVPGVTRVFGAGQGAYAEKIKVDWRTVIEVPERMGLDEAAGLYITAPTSYAALVTRANTQPGEWVLVHAAAGGGASASSPRRPPPPPPRPPFPRPSALTDSRSPSLALAVGLAAVQIAKALGAKVIATAGSQAKLDVAKRYGADFAIDYRKDGWQKEVMSITNGHGADVVYDPVGMIVPSLKCIAWNGRLVVVGFAAGSIEKVRPSLSLSLSLSLPLSHIPSCSSR